MIVNLDLENHCCTVIREDKDPKIYGGNFMARGESNLLHKVKKELQRQGYDVIKKRMWKDGHLVDELQQYIRTRKGAKGKSFQIWNGSFQIWSIDEKYNEGRVLLLVESDIWEK
jgi:hypothetical protein